MKIHLKTRSLRDDYMFLGHGPAVNWWTSYSDFTSFAQTTILVERVNANWHIFFGRIPSSRRDYVGTPISYILVAEGSVRPGANSGAVRALAASLALAVREDGTGLQRLGELLDNRFPEDFMHGLWQATLEEMAALAGARVDSALREMAASAAPLPSADEFKPGTFNEENSAYIWTDSCRELFFHRLGQICLTPGNIRQRLALCDAEPDRNQILEHWQRRGNGPVMFFFSGPAPHEDGRPGPDLAVSASGRACRPFLRPPSEAPKNGPTLSAPPRRFGLPKINRRLLTFLRPSSEAPKKGPTLKAPPSPFRLSNRLDLIRLARQLLSLINLGTFVMVCMIWHHTCYFGEAPGSESTWGPPTASIADEGLTQITPSSKVAGWTITNPEEAVQDLNMAQQAANGSGVTQGMDAPTQTLRPDMGVILDFRPPEM